jgi:hypothetical protein
MADSASLTNNEVQMPSLSSSGREPTNTVAVEVAVVDEDAMDTTPDTETGLLEPNRPTESVDAIVTPTSPPTNGAVEADQPDSNDSIIPSGASDDAVSQTKCLG